MISPELLRRYPFFGALTDAQLKAIAMITEEETFEKGQEIFQGNRPALSLCLLLEGSLDLYYTSEEEFYPKTKKEYLVGEINPGEPFSISAMIDPFVLTASVRASQAGRYIKTDAHGLRALCELDCGLGYNLMRNIANAAIERLHYTRIELAAARA